MENVLPASEFRVAVFLTGHTPKYFPLLKRDGKTTGVADSAAYSI